MSRRRGPSTGLRQVVALLAAFAVGLALVVVAALLAPDVLRISAQIGTSAAAADARSEVADAAVRDGDDGGTSADGAGAGDSAPPDEPESAEPTEAGDAAPSDVGRGAADGDGAEQEVSDGDADPDGAEPSDAEPDVAAQVLELVNAERAAAGCADLRADPALDDLARAHSRDMAARGFFDHTTPDGLSPWDRAAAAGVPGVGAENIARGQPDAEAVVAAWMDSPGHRANILSCDLTRHGLGREPGAGGPWWTQVFGR